MSTTKKTSFPIKRRTLKEKASSPTDPNVLYRCPKCGKEKLGIAIDMYEYCPCQRLVDGKYMLNISDVRMQRVKK